MFKIARLVVEGLRGFAGPQSFEFRRPVTVLFGENGTGKSSTLNAIEWCFSGKECVGAGTGIRERAGWEVANRFRSPADVSAEGECTDPHGSFTVLRSMSAGTARRRDTLELKERDGPTFIGPEAEEKLRQLVPFQFRDFLTTTYQHQEAIRAVLVQEARERNDAIDRLLGLSDYRNILTGIENAKISKAFKDLSGEKDRIARDIDFAVRQRVRDLEDVQQRAEAAGLITDDLSGDAAVRLASQVADRITAFLEDSGLVTPEFEAPADVGQLAEFIRLARRALSRARAEIPAITRQQELLGRRNAVLRFQQTLNNLDVDRQRTTRTVRDYERAHRSQHQLEASIENIQTQESDLQMRLRELNAKAPLVKEGISLLESLQDGDEKCPLCGSSVPNLLAQLQTEWEDEIGNQASGIEVEMTAKSLERQQLVRTMREWSESQKKIAELEEEFSNFRRAVAETLKLDIADGENLNDLLTRQLSSVQNSLDSVEQTVTAKMRSIGELDQLVDQVDILREFLNLSRRIERLDSIRESEEYQLLETAFQELAEFVADLDAIKRAVADASRSEADGKVTAASRLIDEYFRRTANHPGLDRVALEVDSDRRTGRNSYTFADQRGEDLFPVLSQGDMNCLALSIFLGLSAAAAKSSPFGFLLLDDPSQSLGSEEKKFLATLIKNVSDKTDIIVATMDAEFRDLLLKEIPAPDVTTYDFIDWTPDKGPVVVEAA